MVSFAYMGEADQLHHVPITKINAKWSWTRQAVNEILLLDASAPAVFTLINLDKDLSPKISQTLCYTQFSMNWRPAVPFSIEPGTWPQVGHMLRTWSECYFCPDQKTWPVASRICFVNPISSSSPDKVIPWEPISPGLGLINDEWQFSRYHSTHSVLSTDQAVKSQEKSTQA